MTADLINGSFELLAGLFVLNHCRVLHAHKQTRGVSIISAAFFTLWGFWNLYYYPALNQPLSFYGGLFVVAANAFYVGMMLRYRNRRVWIGIDPARGEDRTNVVFFTAKDKS